MPRSRASSPARDVHGSYRRAFAVPATPALDAFEALMAHAHRNVEYSAKIDGTGAHHGRMAVIFDRGIPERLTAIRARIDALARLPAVTLDLTLYERVMRGLALDRVTLCAFGLDVRERVADSRLKVWWSIVDQPDKVRDLVDAHGGDDSVEELVRRRPILAGVDLGVGGAARLKLYPKYTPADLVDPEARRVLDRWLSPAALAWMSRARRTSVSFEPGGARTLHFQPLDTAAAVGEVRNPRLRPLDEQYRALGLRLNVVSLPEEELERTTHDHLNVYYAA